MWEIQYQTTPKTKKNVQMYRLSSSKVQSSVQLHAMVRLTFVLVCDTLIIEGTTVTVKCRTAIKTLFLYL
jgi:hypothetical protein